MHDDRKTIKCAYSDSGVVGVWFGALECPGCLGVILSTGTETLRLNSVFRRTFFFLSGPKDIVFSDNAII